MDQRTILLVEDNADDELLTLHALKSNNIRNPVVVAHDGVEAIEYLFATGRYADRRVSDLPAMVLLDLKLPRIDGLEVLARVREDERTRYVPVIILTSSAEDRDLAEGYRLGCNSYVRKPVDFDEFMGATHQLGMYWLLVNETPRPE
jgi:two-component system response regulator